MAKGHGFVVTLAGLAIQKSRMYTGHMWKYQLFEDGVQRAFRAKNTSLNNGERGGLWDFQG